jgi:hypothetical protein
VVQLQVHVGQRLLHVLDVRGRVLQVPIPNSHVRTQRGDVARRAEAGTQQATSVQALQPLRVVDIALAARNSLALARVGQDDRQATILQDLVDRDPIHAGRFHRHGLDSRRHEPVGHAFDIGREALERLHRRVAQFGWNGGDLYSRPNVNAGRIRVDDRQPHCLALLGHINLQSVENQTGDRNGSIS